jgi:hypothetical protein
MLYSFYFLLAGPLKKVQPGSRIFRGSGVFPSEKAACTRETTLRTVMRPGDSTHARIFAAPSFPRLAAQR